MVNFYQLQQQLVHHFSKQGLVAVKAAQALGKHMHSLLLCFVLAAVTTAAFGHELYPEEKVKAAFLYNFLRFVSWPDEPLDEYNVCTYGLPAENEAVFGSIAKIKTDRRLAVSFVQIDDSLEKLDNCQLVYIVTKDEERVKAVLRRMQDRDSLTIGEAPEFLEMGGMIRFVPIADKIRFEINVDATEKAGLKISSNVLKIAVRLVAGR